MKIYCIIPARAGSKRIKNKNLIQIKKKPLLQYSIENALKSKKINKVFVSSDGKKILDFAKKLKVNVLKRSKKISKDNTSTERVIDNFISELKKSNDLPDYIVLLQPTSPFRNNSDIDNAINLLLKKKLDSLFSGCLNKNLFWIDKKKFPKPLNYNYKKRAMEQSFRGQIMENGSIYVFNTRKYKGCRLFGKIGYYLMTKTNSIQIDDKEDIQIANKI